MLQAQEGVAYAPRVVARPHDAPYESNKRRARARSIWHGSPPASILPQVCVLGTAGLAMVPFQGSSAQCVGPQRSRKTFGACGGARCPERCLEATAGTLRTGGAVLQGVCTVPGHPSVQSPAGTWPPVYKVGLCALKGLFRRGLYSYRATLLMAPDKNSCRQS